MPRQRRQPARAAGGREARAIAANLARDLIATRKRRRWTQDRLADAVGVAQTEISYLERGYGSRTSIGTWIAIGIALNQPIAIGFSRDIVEPLNDAGHLAAQELVIRLALGAAWRVTFEAPIDREAPGLTSDLRLDRAGRLVLAEIWNRVDDLGAAARSSDRKLAAVHRVDPGAVCIWLLVDTAANRRIVRRYPGLLRARFPGSSATWVRSVTSDAAPPSRPGIAWIELSSGRLRELRLAAG
jgi:transcriptional regulator with XRE-family HTH domain